jgi:hypothetical protein
MCGNDPIDKLACQQIRDGSGKEAWQKEEIKFEIERLKALLRDPLVSEEEKAIAQSQVANYREMFATVTSTSSDSEGAQWLEQIRFSADVCDEKPQPASGS